MKTLNAKNFYYLDNFIFLLNWVSDKYQHLLNEQELELIHRFRGLQQPAQALLVRMLMRKGDQFRLSKLAYQEIESVESACKQLGQSNLVTLDPQMEVNAVGNLLTKPELARSFQLNLKDSKPLLMETLVQQHAAKLRSGSEWVPELKDLFVQLECRQVFDRFMLMFFGNLHQNLTDFILSDLGLVQYESIDLDETAIPFKQRWEIDCYFELNLCAELIENAVELSDYLICLKRLNILHDTQHSLLENHWLQARLFKLNFRLAYQLERMGEHEQALNLYRITNTSDARIREIRVLIKQHEFELAWQKWEVAYCQSSEADFATTEAQSLARIAKRLAPKVGQEFHVQKFQCKNFSIELSPLSDAETVEQKTADYLMQSDQQILRTGEITKDSAVYFVENSLFTSLLGLWSWEAIFAPVSGAFFHPFQQAPADLYQQDFQIRRQQIFAKLWSKFDDLSYRETILQCFHEKQRISNPLVNWKNISEECLQLALACIKPQDLKAIFEHMLSDLKNHRSGIPDLVQFFPEHRKLRFIEVKGPGDRLQDNQTIWLKFLDFRKMDASVCWVSYTEIT